MAKFTVKIHGSTSCNPSFKVTEVGKKKDNTVTVEGMPLAMVRSFIRAGRRGDVEFID